MLGVDVVSIERVRLLLESSPGLEKRLFTEPERAYCNSQRDPVQSFAGTLAAKEAVIKALRLGPLVAWARRIEITRDSLGAPSARIGGRSVEVSISHDAGVAVAAALALPEA
ncbi:MAG: 4'-phosphopantetheinyl transferase superfamily protein [Actinomycetota bacterium]|nr:4'-phosphopantetheinyl transferase superfamily protein [Actinomycetota bacterium]